MEELTYAQIMNLTTLVEERIEKLKELSTDKLFSEGTRQNFKDDLESFTDTLSKLKKML